MPKVSDRRLIMKTMIEQIFLDSVIRRFGDYRRLGEKTFDQLSEEDMHVQPNEESNSIAVIIHHLHGNMLSRWTNFLTEDGEKAWRQRDDEFEIHCFSRQQLMDKWNEGWSVFLYTLESLTPEDLSKTITIRNEPLNVVDAINRQMAHYSYHVGQIVYIAKWVRGPAFTSLTIPRNRSNEFNQQMFQRKP